ncbi:MAG: CRISPR-associated protein Csm7 [Pseudomonadota bacterium]|nr:CRISPR-associated protein Csm7 [Pseudomonadota bacterium]
MQRLILRLTPLSAFGTPLKGDTIFGQLCWAIRNRLGEDELTQLLGGYTEGRPFAVVSDAFPAAHVPMPTLPSRWFREVEGEDRKAVKKRCWLPLAAIGAPLSEWLRRARTPLQVSDVEKAGKFIENHPQAHNTIHRLTGTTGQGQFAPYTVEQAWYRSAGALDCHIVLDESRLEKASLRQCMADIGAVGFGRDASIGLGKFSVDDLEAGGPVGQPEANASLTLAPCAPGGQGFDPRRSFYPLFTRFGRHGDIAVHQTGRPFKNPVLLAGTGAVFAGRPPDAGFVGQGLGGNGRLSKAIPGTVQQGYAPIVAIHLPEMEPEA